MELNVDLNDRSIKLAVSFIAIKDMATLGRVTVIKEPV